MLVSKKRFLKRAFIFVICCRPGFKIIKESGDTHIIVDCSIDILEEVLTQAQQVGIMGDGYNYLVTNLVSPLKFFLLVYFFLNREKSFHARLRRRRLPLPSYAGKPTRSAWRDYIGLLNVLDVLCV